VVQPRWCTTSRCTEAKHYAAYGYGGRDGGMPAEISENTLYDVYLKPWYKYAQAGVAMGDKVMKCRSPLNVLKYTSDHSCY
jgi:hypothetical protein